MINYSLFQFITHSRDFIFFKYTFGAGQSKYFLKLERIDGVATFAYHDFNCSKERFYALDSKSGAEPFLRGRIVSVNHQTFPLLDVI